MRTYQHTSFGVLDDYDIFYGWHKSDAGAGWGRRRRFLDCYGFRFSTSLWNLFVIELRYSTVFSVVLTVMGIERIGKIGFVFDLILHAAYTVCACALTSILPSLSLIDMTYCKADTGVGSERRRRFWDWYGFRFPTTLWNVFIKELRDFIVFSVVQTVVVSWVSLG
jgi:hypothetical protein